MDTLSASGDKLLQLGGRRILLGLGVGFSKVPKLFGWHNSLCTLKAKASRGTKLCHYCNFYSLNNIWKNQLYRISGLQFYEWLLGTFEKRVPGEPWMGWTKSSSNVSYTSSKDFWQWTHVFPTRCLFHCTHDGRFAECMTFSSVNSD